MERWLDVVQRLEGCAERPCIVADYRGGMNERDEREREIREGIRREGEGGETRGRERRERDWRR